MSSLRERLLRHKRAEIAPACTIGNEQGSIDANDFDSDAIEDVHRESAKLEAGWTMIGAELCESEWGAFILRRTKYPLSHAHGIYQLGDLHANAAELSAFGGVGVQDEGESAVTAKALLFLDTETTGLGIGAGNVPFMIGLGYYTDDSFVTEQLLIRNPQEELAMLDYLQRMLNRFTHLVTYNGRTFDWPLVQNRFVLNRRAISESLRHIDLLHPSRSVWKNTLPTCRLSQVEEDRLGVHRMDDVPGSLAPALYFQYLAEGNPTLLHGVFKHNELDVLSMASLVIHFAKLLSGQAVFSRLTLQEQYRAAMWLSKMGKQELAHELLDEVWQALIYGSFAGESGSLWQTELPLRLAAWYKQQAEYERAVQLWHGYIELRDNRLPAVTEPYIELAIHYEHRERNLAKALSLAEAAYEQLNRRKSLRRWANGSRPESNPAKIQELQKRIQRLRTKLHKSGNAM